MLKKSILLTSLLIATLSFAADTEWGLGAAKLSDWKFANYNNVKYGENEISGVTICQLGVISPFLYSPTLDWDASPDDVLALEIKCSHRGYGDLHYRPDNMKSLVDELKIKYTTPGGDGEWHIMFIPLKHYAWKGKIRLIRLALRYEEGVEIAIRRIKLLRKPQKNDNLLENGDFAIPGANGIPYQWSFSGDGIKAIPSNANGKSAMRLVGKGTAVLSYEPAYIDFLEDGSNKLILFFLASSNAPGKLTATVTMQDALTNEIDKVEKQWDLSPLKSDLPGAIPEWPISLDTARVLFSLKWECTADPLAEESKGAALTISNVLLQQRKAPPMTWSGEWIRPGDKPDDPPREMYFRKFFDVPNDVTDACLLLNSDNIVRNVFINGEKLPATPNASIYNAADLLRVKQFVKPGRNLLAVHAYNFDLLGGIIFDIAIKTPKGWSRIGSDESWLSLSDEKDGWTSADFDDSKWFKPILMGRGAGTPFGALEYPKILEDSHLSIKQFKISPNGKSPLSLHYDISIAEVNQAADAKEINLAIFYDGDKKLMPNGYRIATIPVKTDDTRLEGDIAFPDFLPSGKVSLRLDSQTCTVNVQKVNVTIPKFKRPPCPAALKVNSDYAPYLQLGDKQMEILHHWCGADGKMTEELMGNCREEHVPFYMGNAYSGWGWFGEGKYDFSALDKYIYRMLEVDPNAHFSMQIAVDNYHNRQIMVWLNAHPSECAMHENGTTVMKQIHSAKNIKVVSYASKPWLDEMYNSLVALSRHLRQSPFGHRAISIQPISGMGGEWCYWGTFSTGGGIDRLDYSRPYRQYFSDFAIKKYGSLEKMNAAWGTEFAAPEEIRIPSTYERDHNDWFEFLDAKKNRRVIDFRQAFSELIANDVITVCKAIKTGSDNQMYAGTFYGYITYVADEIPIRTEGGHFALGKILNSPYVDYLTHLLRYDNRLAGEAAGFMTPESSMLLHGKVPFVQADIRTHRLPPEAPDAVYGRLNNLKEGISVIQRDFSNALLNGVGYEFGYYGQGWIAGDKRMMRTVGRCRDIEKFAREKGTKRIDTENSIAVIVDDITTYYSSQASPIHNLSLKYQMPEFSYTGVGIDTYLLEDLPLMPQYKCYVFLNTYHLTPEQQDFIQKNLKRDGKVLAFMYAQGIATDDGIVPSKVQEITGIKTDVLEKTVKQEIKYIQNSEPAGKYLPVGKTFGCRRTLGPMLVPREGTVLATLTEDDAPALVLKKFSDHTVCYSSIIGLSAEIVKGLAEISGITVINQTKTDCTYVSDNMFAVHTGNGGRRTFHVPPKYTKKATELFTGREFPIQNGKFEYSMEPISTALFFME